MKTQTLILKDFGHFLSGRSLATKIVAQAPQDTIDVVLDFGGVTACNQSFVNELFQQLDSRGVKVSAVTFVGMDNKILRDLVEREHKRYVQITSMPAKATL